MERKISGSVKDQSMGKSNSRPKYVPFSGSLCLRAAAAPQPGWAVPVCCLVLLGPVWAVSVCYLVFLGPVWDSKIDV